ncbi:MULTISPECIES: TDT family transporter [Aeromicrobium]|jgi:C4-dicarboxylate transporter/malic acid transport protein|uniref:TDT family transporter n=1 Tax=Aeromicrobium fastidiosum TaxID=52699 RepID=A0A641AM08_9ACTN|nr:MULTISPECIES: TDT family transporter [Aeromicrobium]KAA1378169.1 TDT family transporter [Aeromicrobium fastidiosum]KQX72342.1 C4-dicarboxylate ABC transporter [Aeromicrobium sp. Root472D3]MBP2389024.1 C4-dicarboxylate transporter/malic acid transport protein [Aeromicrobium fastidiosum]
MTTAHLTTTSEHAARSTRDRTGWLRELEGAPALGFIGPNWFASVMGTGIVAIAAASLPFSVPGITVFATTVWVLALLLLVAVVVATAGHWTLHGEVARGHLDDPMMSHFYGAPAMGLMTVGAGAMLVGHHLIGMPAALALDWVLWTVGTLLGLTTAVLVPIRAFTSHEVREDSAFGGWLMPVVPPMVSAATGAALIPHLPAGQAQQTMLLACYMFFGLTLMCSIVMIAFIWNRLLHHGIGAAGAVPTLWIVLGPVGQSITAAHHLGNVTPDVLDSPYGTAFHAFALVYGIPMWGFAMLWLAIAATLTARTAREGLPFSLTWWSFTFPVGTVVTGTSGLAQLTGNHVLQVAAGALFVLLLSAWSVVAVRTLRGVHSGKLLKKP